MTLQKTPLLLSVAILSVAGIVVLRVTAQADTAPPVISGIFVDTITENSAILHWVTDEPAGTTPKIDIVPGVYTPKSNGVIGTTHTYTATELTPARTYHYRIYAQDDAGNVAESGDYTFTTLTSTSPSSSSGSTFASTPSSQSSTQAVSSTPSLPIAPSNVAATAQKPGEYGTPIILSWSDIAANETHFKAYARSSSDKEWIWLLSMRIPSNSTSFTFPYASNGLMQEYRVEACNDVGCTSSPIVTATAGCYSADEVPQNALADFGAGCKARGLTWYSEAGKSGYCRRAACNIPCTVGIAVPSVLPPIVICRNGVVPSMDFDCAPEATFRIQAEQKCQSYGGSATIDFRKSLPCAERCTAAMLDPIAATGATTSPITVSPSTPIPSPSPSVSPSGSEQPRARPSTTSVVQTGAVVFSPKVQTGSTVRQKVSKAKVRVRKKKQQKLRKELRTLERSLLRKKNVAALSQIADLRDELADLDLRDPSAAETLKSLQEEIADLRLAVTKKAKPSHSGD